MPLWRSGKSDMRPAQGFSIFWAPIGLDFKFYGFLGMFGVWHTWFSFGLEYWNAEIVE
jgi:hypothetical protein